MDILIFGVVDDYLDGSLGMHLGIRVYNVFGTDIMSRRGRVESLACAYALPVLMNIEDIDK